MFPSPAQRDAASAPTRSRTRAGLAVVVVCFWLAWSIPALVAVNRPVPPLMDAQDILLQLTQSSPLPPGAAVLLASGEPGCACEQDRSDQLRQHATRAGLTVMSPSAPGLPYPVVVLDAQHQLVYAGSAALPRNCIGNAASAWPLIAQLLQGGQRTPFYSAPCLC